MKYTKGEQCSAEVYDSFGFGHMYQCQKKAVLERDGRPYCKIHDPSYIEAKRKARSEKWEADRQTKHNYIELQYTAVRVCKKINPSNPMVVAESIPEMYELLKGWLRHFATQEEIPPITKTERLIAKLEGS